ncbi:hypothetical protein GGR60_001609 [Xanthomonas arboricola]|uniref:hypothetical protein n=1 Tax=Xanthomonas euroxanthea TaxID=2259622 RepID=UPI00141ACE7D|nr:hypothetical protein [Xanthomonas euroxanthea]NIK09084.1 hypothetical protein [Xanthomonas euroxanthea]NJC37074.1 hypothetical protein [Xanthomonas euroxanthea]CAG2097917.1 hypothetical protein XCY_004078 [Xanthomonas euroxanthea]
MDEVADYDAQMTSACKRGAALARDALRLSRHCHLAVASAQDSCRTLAVIF